MGGCDSRGRRLVIHGTDIATITPVLEEKGDSVRKTLSRILRHLTGPALTSLFAAQEYDRQISAEAGSGRFNSELNFAQFAIRGSSKAAYCRNGPSTVTGRHNNKGEPGEAFTNGRRSRAGDRRRGSVWLFERQEKQLQRIVEREHRGSVEWLLDIEGHHRRQRPDRARCRFLKQCRQQRQQRHQR